MASSRRQHIGHSVDRHARRATLWPFVCVVGALLFATEDAGAQSIRAGISRSEATVQDQLVLTLVVEGSRSARPQLPELPDFDTGPRGQSTQMSFVNGQLSSSVTYEFILAPKRSGTFTIGPATVNVDGEIFSSKPFTVRILEADQQAKGSQDIFISAKVSTTSPFVGQEIIYVWRFYRRVKIADAKLEPHDFDGFLVEELGEVREYQSTVNGIQYLVSEIRKSLFPQEVGSIVIPASRLTCQVLVRNRGRSGSMFDDIFGSSTEAKVLRSRQIELEVQPLPAAPAEFSGLVGQFEIAGDVSQAELKVGESTTLRLTVRGSGNVQLISEPALPELPGFKTYGDQPKGSIERSGARLKGYKTYSRALVPLETGDPVIPPVELTYFDPDARKFRTAKTAAIPLRVNAGEGREDLNLTESIAPATGKVAVRILADDLLPTYKGLEVVTDGGSLPREHLFLFGALLAPAVLFFGTLVLQRRQARFASDHGLLRRHQAIKRFRRGIRQMSKGFEDPEQKSQVASKVLRQYIGDKLGVEGAALTPAEVDQLLTDHGVSSDLVQETHELLSRFEASQYGSSATDGQSLAAGLESTVKLLEKQIKG